MCLSVAHQSGQNAPKVCSANDVVDFRGYSSTAALSRLLRHSTFPFEHSALTSFFSKVLTILRIVLIPVRSAHAFRKFIFAQPRPAAIFAPVSIWDDSSGVVAAGGASVAK